jgi:hypothetical protein
MLDIARGNLAEAQVLLDEALASAREHKHWMLGQVLTNVGDVAVRQRRLEPAGAALDEARTLLVAEYDDALSGAAAWRLATLDSVAGSYEIERRRFTQAEKYLTGAWPVLHARFGARSYFGDQCLMHLIRLYEVKGDGRAAGEYRALLRSRPGTG